MYSIAQQRVLPPLNQEEQQELLKQAHLRSISELFEVIADPRGRHGLRYDLPFLLTCLVAALLSNCESSEAVSQWCYDHQELLRTCFGARMFLTPSGSLYRWLLPQMDAQAVEQVIGTWVQATLQAAPDEPLALDGKTVRGARTAEHPAPHLLSFCTHHSQETLLQVRVSEKTNEIPVAQKTLPSLPIAHRVCTADALHTQTEFMRVIHELHAETVLTVKDNQPTLHADLLAYFADPHAIVQTATTTDRHRGRKEQRSIRVSTELNTYLASSWPFVRQVAQLTRTITHHHKTTQEVVYLITSLTPQDADPLRLLALIRGHWSIENRLHYVRDVSFHEDRSRIRTGDAPQVLAALRNLVITLIHRSGSSQIAATRLHFASCPQQAFALLLPKGGQQ